ncbi:ROK family transcriptional regulator [Ruania halotolerans]|uniref:ROK family transcriptional regulator n=1 Tax=Ruania halotolerans TaxID=2897773 RepID=UPI001E33DEE9|nr:ROK family transcriptional regulator [Ruania halotolerans]UFU05329.1 ROK family transcriptional regulator [Ruania halotolerans]
MAMTSPGSRRSPRAHHEARVLDVLRVHGSASRAQLAASTGLSRATISAITSDLRQSGLIIRSNSVAAHPGVGRTPERLTLNPGSCVIVGVEFSHTRVTVAVSDVTHRILGSKAREHGRDEPWVRRLGTATAFIDSLVAAPSEPIAIGLGVPGAITGRETVMTGLEQQLGEKYGVPIRMENNARLAGLAEFSWGAGREMTDLIYLRLSEGVGGVLIVDGEPRLGTTGSAGELGHVCINPDGPICRCSNRGCLEAYVGLGALLATAGASSVPELIEALDRAEPGAQAAITEAGSHIGLVLANTCRILDLSSIVLGGPLAQVGEHLVRVVKQTIMRHVHSTAAERLQIRAAELGNLDGALGGVALVLRDRTIPVGTRPLPAHARRTADAAI